MAISWCWEWHHRNGLIKYENVWVAPRADTEAKRDPAHRWQFQPLLVPGSPAQPHRNAVTLCSIDCMRHKPLLLTATMASHSACSRAWGHCTSKGFRWHFWEWNQVWLLAQDSSGLCWPWSRCHSGSSELCSAPLWSPATCCRCCSSHTPFFSDLAPLSSRMAFRASASNVAAP